MVYGLHCSNKREASVAWAQFPGAADIAAKTIAGTLAAGAGYALGGAQGAGKGMAVEVNNRQLHESEAKKLSALKAGKTQEEMDRLDAAACALVHCADGVPESDADYKKLREMQTRGTSYTAELQLLNSTGEFNPTGVQANFEQWSNGKKISNGHLVVTP